jgi:hypothetical protein
MHDLDDDFILPPPPPDESANQFETAPTIRGKSQPQRHGQEGRSGTSGSSNTAKTVKVAETTRQTSAETTPQARIPRSPQGVSTGQLASGKKGANTKSPSNNNHSFTICLDKAHGDSLGLEVMQDGNDGVVIQAITGGLAGQWNANNPQSQVMAGDRIAEINGVLDPHEMLKRCREEDILMVSIERRGAPHGGMY